MFSPVSFVSRLSDDGLAIFLFHGAIDRHAHTVRNYNRKHIAREEFLALIRLLKEHGTPFTMDDVLAHCVNRIPFPPRSFALTFDDGFENNASVAAPILFDAKLPATFYVTTGWMGTTSRSWVDRLEACLEHALPGTLRLPWEHIERPHAHPGDRIAILEAIRGHVKRQRAFDREVFVADVYAQCGVDERATWSDPLDRKLSWEQVREIAAEPLFTIGSHTHTHAMLSYCTPNQREDEIATSIRLLRERVRMTTRHFAYPEGLAHHFDDDVITRLKAHEIMCCPTAIDGISTHEMDPFSLRRIPVMWTAHSMGTSA